MNAPAEILVNGLYAPFFAIGMLIDWYRNGNITPRVACGFTALMLLTFVNNPLAMLEFIVAASIAFMATRVQLGPPLGKIALQGGAMSYALYLIANPIFTLIYFALAPFHADMATVVIASTAFSLATAQMIDNRLEPPIRAALKILFARPWRAPAKRLDG